MKEFFIIWAYSFAIFMAGLWAVIGILCFIFWSTEFVQLFYFGLLRGTATFAVLGGLGMAVSVK